MPSPRQYRRYAGVVPHHWCVAQAVNGAAVLSREYGDVPLGTGSLASTCGRGGEALLETAGALQSVAAGAQPQVRVIR